MTMETIIISSLIVALVILLCIVITRSKNFARTKETESSHSTELPSIIGPPKIEMNRYQPEYKNKSHNEADGISKLGHVNEAVYPENPKQKTENSLADIPNWEEEEEELQVSGSSQSDGGFATGVTFDELASVGRLFEREELQPSEKELAIGMISKIDGTDLLSLLESKVGDASKKIAMLLDVELTRQVETGSSSAER